MKKVQSVCFNSEYFNILSYGYQIFEKDEIKFIDNFDAFSKEDTKFNYKCILNTISKETLLEVNKISIILNDTIIVSPKNKISINDK